jgi:cytidylate kinase
MADANKQTFQIAIDGPVAAGKGTVAKKLAERLGFLYVDTGAMYRAGALMAHRHQLIPNEQNEDQIVALLSNATLDMYEDEQGNLKVILAGEDISREIRTPAISQLVPKVAVLPKVRSVLVEKQQQIAGEQSVVMEGRDITFRVLPEADLKVYLTADAETRAARRLAELEVRGETQTYEQVFEALKARDHLDTTRETDPLQITEDAFVLDTTNLSIEEVVDQLVVEVDRCRYQS